MVYQLIKMAALMPSEVNYLGKLDSPEVEYTNQSIH